MATVLGVRSSGCGPLDGNCIESPHTHTQHRHSRKALDNLAAPARPARPMVNCILTANSSYPCRQSADLVR